MIGSETVIILALSFKTPLRKRMLLAPDKVKCVRDSVVMMNVTATVFMVMISCVWSIMEIQKRMLEPKAINSTDQVVLLLMLLSFLGAVSLHSLFVVGVPENQRLVAFFNRSII